MQKIKNALIPIDDVCKLVKETLRLKKLSRSSIYTYIKHKNFPRAISLGTPRLWRRKEVEAWLTKLIEG
jgi:predicted DNA-binding transcriptional regulator AlpA